MILAIIVFLIILGLLIFSHELGHFLMAKKMGVRVDEFAIFFPPKLYSFKKGETKYSINLIPLGGYVKIYGEDGEHKKNKRSFSAKSISQRASMLVSGVAMNFVLAVFLLTILAFITDPWYNGFYMGLIYAVKLLVMVIKIFGLIIWQLITQGKMIGDVMGPVGIAIFTDKIVASGFSNILYFTALLSVNLCFINLLPLPALDGGRLLFLAIEKIKGKPVNEKIEKYTHTAGLVFLIFLMVLVTWRDIMRLF
tara:strand:+ start:1104 stop:1859 length:756 start_codon:yes stop_codon:yes gene_type:complete